MSDEAPPEALPEELVALEASLAHAEQRVHLRRILGAFVVVVVLMPFVGIGGTVAQLLLLPMLAAAALGLRAAIHLRRSVVRYGQPQH